MNNESVSWGATLRIYWLIVWRTVAMYTLAFGSFSFWLMVTNRLDDADYVAVRIAASGLLLVGTSFIAVRMALHKRYRGFKIQITRSDPEP